MNARFNQILVVDSLPDGELNTAERLSADMRAWATLREQAPEVVRHKVRSGAEFLRLLQACERVALRDPYVPLLHIECHGSEDGLRFSDGSVLHWADLQPALTSLNVATKLNLVVVVAACDGSSVAYTMSAHQRAPLWGFLAPNREISTGALEASLTAFYQTLLATGSAERALEALRQTDAGGTFMFISARTMFRLAIESYQAAHGSPEEVTRRARRLQALARQQGVEYPLALIENMIRDPEILEGFRRTFFMIDIYPDNANRFDAEPL